MGDLGMGQKTNIWNSVANFFLQTLVIYSLTCESENLLQEKVPQPLSVWLTSWEPRVKSVLMFGGTGGGVRFLPAL